MAKIDCSVTENFFAELRRCREIGDCAKCLYSDTTGCILDLNRMNTDAGTIETMVAAVQQWSDEHPVKTRLDDLLEKYPQAKRNEVTGIPKLLPALLRYCDKCPTCRLYRETGGCCWNEPVDGGATGKAVE